MRSTKVREVPVETGVNDVHSRLNRTAVSRVVPVASVDDIATVLADARTRGEGVAVAGGRHAMGGQQFASGAVLLDTRPMRRLLSLDRERGLVEAEVGIFWPELVAGLAHAQGGARPGEPVWGIRQKQTGADDFTLGGSVSANCHGRVLDSPPIVADVEALRVLLPDGTLVQCSRSKRPELFALVVGGYGLFGVIVSVTLRLAPRLPVERMVRVATADEVVPALETRAAEGCAYGDFQFAVDSASPDFLRRGVLSCYRPVEPGTRVLDGQRVLSRSDWQRLLTLAHVDKTRAYEEYVRHYLATSGQLYWSDTSQLADYVGGYHDEMDRALGAAVRGSEMIGELYVPRDRLADFLDAAARDLRRRRAEVVYGTVRLIRRDEETFLAWARKDFACVVVNLHVPHTPAGVARAASAFRALVDLAIVRRGSYYLTYSRWARRDQLLTCYPQFGELLRRKRGLDPDEVLTSDWYRHCRDLVGGPAEARGR